MQHAYEAEIGANGHSAAHFLKWLGFDLKDIQVWLRHSDISTTGNTYLDFDMEEKKIIANRLDAQYQSLKMATR